MRRWLKLLLGGLALLAVLAACAVLVLRSQWLRDRVRQRILAELEAATGGRVEIAAFDYDWRQLSAQVRGLVIRGAEGPGQAPLFRARSITIGLRIVSLFKRQIDIERLAVDAPETNLIVYPDGRTNLPVPKARAPRRDPVEEILNLAVKRFSLASGALRVGLKSVPVEVQGDDLRVQVTYEKAGPRYRGQVSFQQVTVGPWAGKLFPLELEATLALERNRLEVSRLRAGRDGSRLEASGVLTDFASPRGELRYAAGFEVKDLAPLARIDALEPRGSVTLEGQGRFDSSGSYWLGGRVKAVGLAFRQRGVRIANVAVNSDVALTPDKLEFSRLLVAALRGRLAGAAELHGFRQFRLAAALSGLALEELTALPGAPRATWSGVVAGPLELAGALRDGELRDWEASARLTVAPGPGPHPVEGFVDASYSTIRGRLDLGRSWLATPLSRIQFTGTLGQRMEVDLRTASLADLEPLRRLASEKPPAPLPVRMENGEARFHGVVTGTFEEPQIQGRLAASNLVCEGHAVDRLEAGIAVSRKQVRIENLLASKRRMRLSGSFSVGLEDWAAAPERPVSGSLTLRAPDVAEVAAAFGQSLPASGELTTELAVSGTVGAPQGAARITLVKGAAYGEPFDRLEAQARYASGRLELPAAAVQLGKGRVDVTAAWRHPPQDFKRGNVQFELTVKDVELGRLRTVQQRSPGLEGRLEGRLGGGFDVTHPAVRLNAINGQLRFHDLGVERTPLGSLLVTAATGGRTLNVNLAGTLAGSTLHGSSQCTLQGPYPAQGTIEFGRVNLTALRARLGSPERRPELPFDGYFSGRVTFSGSVLEPPTWRAAIDLPAVEFVPRIAAAQLPPGADLGLRNRGPVRVDVDSQGATIRKADWTGPGTEANVSGTVTFRAKPLWNIRLQGTIDLAALKILEPELTSSGKLLLDAVFRGSLDRPEVYGRAEIQNGALYLAGLPNGLDGISAVAFLYRDRATLERFQAESGGGRVAVTGFVGFGAPVTYHLQARAEQVRYRDPTGASVTANALVNLTGTSERSVLGGEAIITRISFNPQTDLGSLLAASAQPAPPPTRPGVFTEGLRFDVRVRTAPQARLETALTRGLQAEADLRLRGDPGRPALLGRVLVHQGEVLFFGNKYTIDSGDISFVNPGRIEPIVKLDLQTKVRGVDVTLTLTGPITKMNVTYRSDPPLQLADIVGLLATGREPASAPGLVGARTAQSQSWEQAGATALMGQAIATPLAGRLQRFFGVSRLKIDPTISGATGTPEARVTLEQQLSPTLTFTYITNLTRAQEQALRIEWGITKEWSVVALREENGLFGLDFLYKRRFK